MSKRFLMALICLFVCSSVAMAQIKISSKVILSDTPNDNYIHQMLMVENTGSESVLLDTTSVGYYFYESTYPIANFSVEQYWTSKNSMTISNDYVNISFDELASAYTEGSKKADKKVLFTFKNNLQLAAGEYLEIQYNIKCVDTSLGWEDWKIINETDDWSYNSSQSYTVNTSIVVFNQLQIAIAGTTPPTEVAAEDLEIITHPISNTTILGDGTSSAAFTVVAENATSYEWYKNGTLIPGENLATIVLANVALEDAGEYTAKVYSTTGAVTELTSDAAQLIVIDNLPKDLTGISGEGNSVTFTLGAGFSPALSVNWLFQGNIISNGHTATISPVSITNAGTYTVTIVDAFANTYFEHSVDLSVTDDPDGYFYPKLCDANNKMKVDQGVIIGKVTSEVADREMLEVAGNVRCEGVKLGLWTLRSPTQEIPDYVFRKDYNLSPLNEVEEFIKKNKHLPNVPSEEEINTNGINITDLNLILLRKIEELTLYSIEQQKVIAKLQEKISE